MASGRSIIRISLDTADVRALEDLCEKRGMTQISLVSRMVVWLAQQEYDIQTDILTIGVNTPSKAKSVKLLKRIAAQRVR
jgi:hypothetical protein